MKSRSKLHLFTTSYLFAIALLITYLAVAFEIKLAHVTLVAILILVGLSLTLLDHRLNNLAHIVKNHTEKEIIITKKESNK